MRFPHTFLSYPNGIGLHMDFKTLDDRHSRLESSIFVSQIGNPMTFCKDFLQEVCAKNKNN